ncbi:hypothetical protein PF004_g30335, partial [Phytophthora fragariae]
TMSMAALCSECFSSSDEELSDASTAASAPHPRKTHTPPCQVEGCKNLSVSRGLCVRHGGGSKCTEPGCNKRAKLCQRCFQHGGYKMCTEPGCNKKAKRYGHCWSHGGGHICEAPSARREVPEVQRQWVLRNRAFIREASGSWWYRFSAWLFSAWCLKHQDNRR